MTQDLREAIARTTLFEKYSLTPEQAPNLYAEKLANADAALSAIRESGCVVVPVEHQLGLGDAMSIAARGLLRWAEKEHNAKWWRRIDGTPIVNDLPINIAEEFVLALKQRTLASPYEVKP